MWFTEIKNIRGGGDSGREISFLLIILSLKCLWDVWVCIDGVFGTQEMELGVETLELET